MVANMIKSTKEISTKRKQVTLNENTIAHQQLRKRSKKPKQVRTCSAPASRMQFLARLRVAMVRLVWSMRTIAVIPRGAGEEGAENQQ